MALSVQPSLDVSGRIRGDDFIYATINPRAILVGKSHPNNMSKQILPGDSVKLTCYGEKISITGLRDGEMEMKEIGVWDILEDTNDPAQLYGSPGRFYILLKERLNRQSVGSTSGDALDVMIGMVESLKSKGAVVDVRAKVQIRRIEVDTPQIKVKKDLNLICLTRYTEANPPPLSTDYLWESNKLQKKRITHIIGTFQKTKTYSNVMHMLYDLSLTDAALTHMKTCEKLFIGKGPNVFEVKIDNTSINMLSFILRRFPRVIYDERRMLLSLPQAPSRGGGIFLPSALQTGSRIRICYASPALPQSPASDLYWGGLSPLVAIILSLMIPLLMLKRQGKH